MRIIFLYLIIGQTFAISNNFESINVKKTIKLKLLQDIYRPVPFISHDNPSKAYGTYLSRNISFEPISKVRKYIELQRNLKLKHRGEAHITVITPPEYNLMKQWNPRINIKSINHLVKPLVQHMNFNILGIGSLKGTNTNSKESEVFFLVIKSSYLINKYFFGF